jgi:Tol biopolymer transport system component/predicted Ser/Thr protein kinase
MPLSPGDHLGPYEILALVGKGGMGEVYRAHDDRLRRDVAIKVSNSQFTERFTREARTIASLNHTNIAHLYDVGPNYLVMEFVEGEDLKGPLDFEDALPIIQQLIDGIEAAHEKNIIHRDLKPANIKITPEGVVKILDFGLAKAMEPPPSSDADPGNSPTLTMGATVAGTILGTAAYMAPEQAKGKAVDKRGDIWSFGVVVYEMLTGKRLFQGESVVEILGGVLNKEADISAAPARIQKLLGWCLEKDRKKRLAAISDARRMLEESGAEAPRQAEGLPHQASKLPWMAAGVMAAVAVVGIWAPWKTATQAELPLTRLSVDLGPTAIAADYNTFAISPDGRRILYTVRTVDGHTQFATRLLEETEETHLSGTDGGQNPFFSPDGKEIAFFADSKLKKTSVGGGASQTLADAAGGYGGDWAPDGTIYFSVSPTSPISRIAANGGTPVVTTVFAKGTSTHRWPQFIATANALLYTASGTIGSMTGADLWLAPLKGGEPKLLVRGAYSGKIVESAQGNFLVYVREGALFGVAFDPQTLEVTGTAIPLLEDLGGDVVSGAGHFDISRSGTLLYRNGRQAEQTWPVLWLDKTGQTKPLLANPATYGAPRFSPDGKRLALNIRNGTSGGADLHLFDLERETLSRLTSTGKETYAVSYPVWTPDGKHIVVRHPAPAGSGLAWYRADGAGEAQLLLESANNLWPSGFSPDGKVLAFNRNSPETLVDLWTLPLDLSDPEHPKAGKPQVFVQTPAAEYGAAISPDGKWVAYASSESGVNEVYVKPFLASGGGSGGRWQISAGGGQWPLWAPDGRVLYFTSLDNHILVADVEVRGDAFVSGKPRLWSPTPIRNVGGNLSYAIHPDGKRFAVFPAPEALPEEKGNAHVTFLQNFTDELRRKVAGAK